MADRADTRISGEINGFQAVLAAAAEARRLNDALRSVDSKRYVNPVSLAIEKLQAGLLRHVCEEEPLGAAGSALPGDPAASPHVPEGTQLSVGEMDDERETLADAEAAVFDPRFEQPDQDHSGGEVGDQVPEDFHTGHRRRVRHEDEAGELKGHRGEDPDPEAEPHPFPPPPAGERRPDAPIHVGE
jgi:hypothetical protein